MNKTVLIVAVCLSALFCEALSAQSYAASRGIEVASVKTDAGRKMDLYDASRALVVGVGDYEHWPCLEQLSSGFGKVSRMLGNVWEWVEDNYHDGYRGAPTDGSAWASGTDSRFKVRGGGWISPGEVRSAEREKKMPDYTNNDLGVRLCLPQSGD